MSDPTNAKTPRERRDDQEHIQALRDADQTLKQAQGDIAVGRARLQRAIARYEERASGPRPA